MFFRSDALSAKGVHPGYYFVLWLSSFDHSIFIVYNSNFIKYRPKYISDNLIFIVYRTKYIFYKSNFIIYIVNSIYDNRRFIVDDVIIKVYIIYFTFYDTGFIVAEAVLPVLLPGFYVAASIFKSRQR